MNLARFAASLGAIVAATLTIAAAEQNGSLSKWLPRVGQGFEPFNRHQAAWSKQYDYLICGNGPVTVATPFANFDYAVKGCPVLKIGSAFASGGPEPQRGRAVYDSAHKLVLYQEGCCAWKNAVLASGIAPPPISVRAADLRTVRTMRGITLGMTQARVIAIYGRATPHPVAGEPSLSMLSYTTMHGNPASNENACGQFQNFAFRNGKLAYLELLAGC